MKLHLPIVLRHALLTCGIFTGVASALEWDSNWGDELKKIQGVDVRKPLYDLEELLEPDSSHWQEVYASHFEQLWQNDRLVAEFGSPSADFDYFVYGGSKCFFNEISNWPYENETVLEDAWKGGRRDVWMNVTDGRWAGIVGGNNLELYKRWFGERLPQGTFTNDFEGDVHILIDEDVVIRGINMSWKYTYVVGGNLIEMINYDWNDYVWTSSFKGNTYVSLRSAKTGDYVVGGNYIRYSHSARTTFEGDSNVYVYNIQEKNVTAENSDATMEGLWVQEDSASAAKTWMTWREFADYQKEQMGSAGGNDDESYSEDFINLYMEAVLVAYLEAAEVMERDSIVGGNLINGTYGEAGGYMDSYSTSESVGSSTVYIDLTNRRGDFEKKVIAGDYTAQAYEQVIRKGDTSLIIHNAGGVNFTDCITAGSCSTGVFTTLQLKEGSTNLYIDSGTFQSLVVGGMNAGDMYGAYAYLINAGCVILDGDSNVSVKGASFEGYDYSFASIFDPDEEKKSIGAVALVGGNCMFGNIERDAVNVISGEVKMTLADADFAGHVVGSTVMLGKSEDMAGAEIRVGKTTVKMLNCTMDEAAMPRIVGGMVLHAIQVDVPDVDYSSMMQDDELWVINPYLWTSRYRPFFLAGYCPIGYKKLDDYVGEVGIELGDVEIDIRGKSKVYDVVGGSWVGCEVAPEDVVKQGNISVTLGSGIEVKGHVYAGGIQAGEAPLSAESTVVNIEAGVKFDAGAVVSGAYLYADQLQAEEKQDAFCPWYDQSSTVKGKRTLNLKASQGYGENLSGVIFTNFDEVKVSAEDVELGALLLTDTQGGKRMDITLTGGGKLTIAPGLIKLPGYERQGEEIVPVERELLNLAPVVVTDGSTLHLVAGEGAAVQRVNVEQGSTLRIDLTRGKQAFSGLEVRDSLRLMDGSTLDLHVNLKSDMGQEAIIRKEEGCSGPTAMLEGVDIKLTLEHVDDELRLPGTEVYIVLIDKVLGSISGFNYRWTRESIDKWFGGMGVNMAVDEAGSLVLSNTIEEPTPPEPEPDDEEEPGYHEKRANSNNGKAGGALMDEFFPNPSEEASDRKKVESLVFENNVAENYGESDRLLAAMAGASISVMSSAMSDDLERQMRMVRNRVQNRAAAETEDNHHRAVWVNAEGDYRNFDAKGTDPGYKMNSWGGTLGMAYTTRRNIDLGMALTAMYGDLTSKGADTLKLDTDIYYLSAYAQMRRGKWTHTLVAAAGLVDADGNRTVNMDANYGSYTTTFNTHGHLLGALYEVGRSIFLNESRTLYIQPVMNAAWRHVAIGGFAEDGSDAALRVSHQTMDSVDLGMGVRLGEETGLKTFNRLVQLEGRALVKAYMGDKQNKVEVGFADRAARAKVQSREQSSVGVELGGSASLPLRSRGRKARSLFLDANAELRGDYTNLNATLGYKVQF